MLAPLQSQSPGDRPAPNPRATRSVVLARNGLIATSQPLASAAGLHMLQSGGNAIDAAVAAAAVLAVVEPTMTGIGGDLFALVYDGRARTLRALNASGRSPRAASVEALRARDLTDVPDRGILAVTVPGVVDGWAELLAKHGTLSLDRVLAPAIRYARDGFAVSEIIAHQWEVAAPVLARDASAAKVFLSGGRAPRPGDLFANPALGATLAYRLFSYWLPLPAGGAAYGLYVHRYHRKVSAAAVFVARPGEEAAGAGTMPDGLGPGEPPKPERGPGEG